MLKLFVPLINLLRLPLDFIFLTVDWLRALIDAIRMGIGRKTGKRKSCTFCGSPEYLVKAERPCVAAAKYGNTWLFKGVCPCVRPADRSAHATPYCTNESAFRKPTRILPLSGLLLLILWCGVAWAVIQSDPRQRFAKAMDALKSTERQQHQKYLNRTLSPEEALSASHALVRIDLLIQDGEVEKAEQALADLLDQHPDFSAAWPVQADLHFKQLRVAEAYASLESAERAGVQGSRMRLLRARKLIDSGTTDEALAELDQDEAYTIPQQLERAAIYQLLGQNDRARETLESVVAHTPEHQLTRLRLAVLLFKNGEHEEALKQLDHARVIDPAHPELRLLEVELSLLDGDLEKFKQARDRLGEELHDHLAMQLRIAELEQKTNDAGSALERIEIVTHSPRRSERFAAHLLRAQILMERQLVTDAAREIDLALAIHPTHLRSLQVKAQTLMANKEWGPALKRLTPLREKYPKVLALYLQESSCLEQLQQLEQAEKILQRAYEAFPEDTSITLRLSTFHQNRGAHGEAIRLMSNFLENEPENLFIMNNLVYLLADTEQDLDRAYTLAKKIMERRPNDPVFSDTIGWLQIKRKAYAEAIPHLEMALRGVPNHPVILYHLGLAYQGNGQKEQAIAALKRSIASGVAYKDLEHARDILQRLQR